MAGAEGCTPCQTARQCAEAARELATLKAEAAGQQDADLDASTDFQVIPSRNLLTDSDGNPRGNAQSNHRCQEGCACTDPDGHILKDRDGWIQSYNCQAAGDGDHLVIVVHQWGQRHGIWMQGGVQAAYGCTGGSLREGPAEGSPNCPRSKRSGLQFGAVGELAWGLRLCEPFP